MSDQADVKSIETLAFVKAALAAFAHETGQAVGEVELQGQRAVDWITVDRAAFWKAESRRAADLVNKAMKDLEHCRTFKKVGDNQPSCIEEKKALDKAKRRLELADRKVEAVRRWTPVVQQQFRETCVRLVRFREVIDVDCPRAMASLERMLKALDAYRNAQSPAGREAATSGTGTAAVTRQESDPPTAAPAAGSPPSDPTAAGDPS
jgi:hypothetical protein